jgi:hypothetical protein
MDDKIAIKPQSELDFILSGLEPEELDPRLELQILIDPANLFPNTVAHDNNNNNLGH